MTEMIDSRPGISEAATATNPTPASVPTLQWSWPDSAARPQSPGQRHVAGLPLGSADSLFTACWAVQQAQELRAKASATDLKGALTLVIADSAARYQRLLQEVKAWQPGLRVAGLGDWETLAYEAFSPHQDLISERLNSLYLAITGQLDLLIVGAPTALQRLPPTHYLAANTFFFRTGQSLSVDRLRQQLQTAGYSPVGQVFSPSEYAIRGGLIDLYPMGSTLPYRIELFDDEIASIRVFDPESQRSVHPVREVRILPGREYPRDAESAAKLRSRWRETFEGDPSRCSLYKDAGNGLFGPGIEYYLPLLFDELADLSAYLHPQAQVLLVGDVQSHFEQTFGEVKTRWEFLRHDIERPVLPPETILVPVHQFNQTLSRWGQTLLSETREQSVTQAAPDVRADRQANPVLARLRLAIDEGIKEDLTTVVCVDTDGRRETLAEMLEDSGIGFDRCELTELPSLLHKASQAKRQSPRPGCLLTVSPFHQGFKAPALGLVLITEFELFADLQRRQRHGQRAKQTNVDAIIRDLSELKINDPVVHLQHGVGRYQGLINMDLGDGPNEFLHLVYAENSVLYVPVAQLHLISRYSGSDPDSAPLHRLGGGQWEKAKSKAAKQAKDTAAELLNLYARRAAREGHAFAFQASDYERFADGFGFEETPDQLAAIHAVVQDMVSGKPMDRLVCGDVGFGKTEVALRAAFVAVMDGKQVAVLCPTTLLAEQHFQTFRDRFSAWPVKLAELSRFKSG
ncbi:MAG: CarD family transcriptional regulator, partial [Burkholderiaceae bacterium]